MKKLIPLALCGVIWAAGSFETIFGQQPELVVQSGHSSPVESIVPSPDGRILASVDTDGLVIIWDASTGHELRAFSVPSAWSGLVSFSRDSKTLAYGHSRGVKLWDITSGKELRHFQDESSTGVAFTPNGEAVISVDSGGELVLWVIRSGEKRVLREGLCYVSGGTGVAPVHVQRSLAVSPDGKSVAGFSCNGDAYGLILFDPKTVKSLRAFEENDDTKYASTNYNALAFSADGETLVGAREDHYSRVYLRQEADGRMVETARDEASEPPDKTRVWSASTGKMLASFVGVSPALSPDGKMVATREGGAITLWEVTSRRKVRVFSGQAAAFLPDRRTIAVGSGKAVELFDLGSGDKVKGFLPSEATSIQMMDISSDGGAIVIGVGDSLKLWSLSSDRALTSFEEFKDDSDAVEQTLDEADIRLAALNARPYLSVSFSAKNRAVASAHNTYVKHPEGVDIRSTLVFWDIASGRIDKTFPIDTSTLVEYFVPDVKHVKLSPAGRMLATLQGLKSIKLFDMSLGKVTEVAPVEGFTPVAELINTMLFSRDGSLLAYGDGWGIGLVDTKTGARRYVAGDPSEDSPSQCEEDPDGQADFLGLTLSVVFSPDEKMIGGAFSKGYREEWAGDESDVGCYRFWEVATGREVKFPRLPSWAKFSYRLSKSAIIKGREMRVVADRNQIKLINPKTGKTIVTLVAFDNGDWLVVTPEGFFDGTPNAWKKLFWRFNDNMFDYGAVELYFNDFFYPNLLQDVFDGKAPKPKPGQSLSRVDRRQPKVELAAAGPAGGEARPAGQSLGDGRTATLIVEVVDNIAKPDRPEHAASSGAHDLRLFRNGTLVRVWRGDLFEPGAQDGCRLLAPAGPVEPRRMQCRAEVPIVGGENRFTAYAFNGSNVKSQDSVITVTGAGALKRDGTLHVIAVSINAYANRQYNLQYAVADAEAFTAELKRQQELLKTYGRVEVIPLFDKDATKAKILQTLASLVERAQPEDAVVVYFSGHGTAQRNQFFLIPHDLGYQGNREVLDEAGLQTILAHSISDKELEGAFEKIDAGHILLVIDACNSGQALEAEEKRRGPMNSKGLAQLAYEKGMYILTAAQSYERAWESTTLRHGYLTYALVDEGVRRGLADDEPKDGSVLLREWLNYAARRVPLMQAEGLGRELRRKPQTRRQNPASAKPAPMERQTPRVFYRRETEAVPLIIARP